jgi:hypothetical protein
MKRSAHSKLTAALRKLRQAKRSYDEGVRRLGKSPSDEELHELTKARERAIEEVVSLLSNEEPSLPPRR